MSLEAKIMDHMKEAMKAKDSVALEALRAIKSAIILAKTEAGAGDRRAAPPDGALRPHPRPVHHRRGPRAGHAPQQALADRRAHGDPAHPRQRGRSLRRVRPVRGNQRQRGRCRRNPQLPNLPASKNAAQTRRQQILFPRSHRF